jgi:hypothetical protein
MEIQEGHHQDENSQEHLFDKDTNGGVHNGSGIRIEYIEECPKKGEGNQVIVILCKEG